MSNVITALITIAVLLTAINALAQSGFTSADLLTDGWRDMEARYGERLRTDVEVINTSLSQSTLDVTVRNKGTITLRKFADWDVVVEYKESNGVYHQEWLSYTTSNPPGDNQWTVTGIYIDADQGISEVRQPGLLDPAEEAVIQVKLSASPEVSDTHRVAIGTFNGVLTSATF